MKKRILFLVTAVLLVGINSSGFAAINSVGDPGRSWSQPNDAARGMHIQQFSDTTPGGSWSMLLNREKLGNITIDPTCDSISDPKCVGSQLDYTAIIPRCENATDINCTVDLGTIDASGKKTSAEFNRYFPTKAQNQYIGSAASGLPSGVSGSIFSLPSAIHDGGNLYYLAVTLKGSIDLQGKASKPSLDIKLSPIQLEAADYVGQDETEAGYAYITNNITGEKQWGAQSAGFGGNQYCVAVSMKEKKCAEKYAFPADTRFYVDIRLSNLPTGWMHGRVDLPEIKISPEGNHSLLEIQGNPMAVPVVYKMYMYTEMPADLKKWYSVEKGGYLPTCSAQQSYCAGGRTFASSDPLNRNVIISPSPSSAEGMEQLKLWLPFVGDKATALPSYWSVRTLEGNEMDGASRCFADDSKITGIVTTNSTQYSAGPPTFAKSEGSLNYQVASPHFGSNGDVFKGSYDLVMRSEVARCIYGFSKAPIQATLSITSADGTPQVASTIIGERDGWLYLRAKNFEFSAPTVKVKLSQEAEPKVEVTESPVVAPISKKRTITCTKGKLVKKVSAINPKCPTGYKKKA
ncbi:hypothetical protein MCEMRE195_01155 [Candidatus Nanopelagicaceae bacterium]